MVDWNLLFPGLAMAILGLAGVLISLSGIAQTFLEGMHAMSALMMAFGLILTPAGLFHGGAPVLTQKAKSMLSALLLIIPFGFSVAIFGSAKPPVEVPGVEGAVDLSFVAFIAAMGVATLVIALMAWMTLGSERKMPGH